MACAAVHVLDQLLQWTLAEVCGPLRAGPCGCPRTHGVVALTFGPARLGVPPRALGAQQRETRLSRQHRASVAKQSADTGFEWVTPHTFRKTVATHIDRLVDSDTAARVLGHTPDATTKEFYIEKNRAAPDVTHILQSFAVERLTESND